MTGCSCLIKKEPGGQLDIGNGDDADGGRQHGSSTDANGNSEENDGLGDAEAADDEDGAAKQTQKKTGADDSDAPEGDPEVDSEDGESTNEFEPEPTAKPVTPKTPEQAAELARRNLDEAEELAKAGETEQAYEKALKALDLTYRHAKKNKECENLSERAQELSRKIGKDLKQDAPGVDVPIKIK